MIRIIGETFVDQYMFYKSIRSDPALSLMPITDKIEYEKSVPGGAANLVRIMKKFIDLNKPKEKIKFYTNIGAKHELKNEFFQEVEIENVQNMAPIKKRIYINDQPCLRIDESDGEILRSDALIDSIISDIKEGDVVILSDYGKGLMSQKDIMRILISVNEKNAISFIDTNVLSNYHADAHYVKVNKKTAKEYLGPSSGDYAEEIGRVMKTNVIVTLGGEGSLGFSYRNNKNIKTRIDISKNYIDTIGAGDSFLAGFVMSIILEKDFKSSCEKANLIAANSCLSRGTIEQLIFI